MDAEFQRECRVINWLPFLTVQSNIATSGGVLAFDLFSGVCMKGKSKSTMLPKGQMIGALVAISLFFLLINKDYILTSFYDWTNRGIIDRSILHDKIKSGETVKFLNLSPASKGTLCVLHPYESSLIGAAEPIKTKVNKYLTEKKIVIGEGQWAFVIVSSETISITKYDAYKDIVLINVHTAPPGLKEKLPSNVDFLPCVDVMDAVLFKTDYDDRTYIFLGRSR